MLICEYETMKKILVIWIFFLSIFNLYPASLKFYDINTIHGISMRETFSICKDKSGFIWSSSKTGILRVTGDSYHIYRLPYKTTDITFVKLIYGHSQLIAYTNNGQLFSYNELYDRFDFLVDMREQLHNPYITLNNIVVNSSCGSLWIGSSDGLYTYSDNKLDVVKNKPYSVDYISFLNEALLFYADYNTLEILDLETSKSTLIYETQKGQFIQVSSCYFDKKNQTLWIGTFSHGLYIYDFKTHFFSELKIKGFPHQPILAIESKNDNRLLIGVDGQGIWELDRKTKTVLDIYKEDINDNFSLRGDGVYDIFCDDNKVWVATYTGGLSFFEENTPLVKQINHQINNPNSLGNNDVHQIFEDYNGNIWFTTNNGISRWNLSTNQWKTYYQNKQEQAKVFLTICDDGDGNIWLGTYSSGIYIIDPATGDLLKHYSGEKKETSAPSKFIFDLFKDSEEDIWIGGVDNVMCYLSKEKQFKSYPIKPVNSFYELFPGQILGTYSHGLALIHKYSGDIEILIDSCLAHDVIAIDNDIWIATSGNGLIQYNLVNKSKKWFTTDSGLPSNYLNSLIYTDGYLWIGTENGLCQLNISDYSIQTYSSLLSLSKSAFNINSCIQLKNGNLIWGTNNGALMFTPEKLHQTEHKGRIYLQDIIVSGRSIRDNPTLIKDIPINNQQHIKLDHTQNNLSLELLSLETLSKDVKYIWKLEGLDTKWSQPSMLPVINYANLPSGNFHLVIRMYDSSLSRVIDERSLSILITPPLWKTWWFFLLTSIIIIGIFVYFFRTYLTRLKQKHTKDKIRFFTNMAHDIRTSLTLINAPIEQLNNAPELSEKSRYFLNLATEQSLRLSSVATQLLDFEKVDSKRGQLFLIMTDVVELLSKRYQVYTLAAKKKNLELEFSSNVDSYVTALDELKIEKIIDNLLSNAIKYSHQGGRIEIRLVCDKEKWNLEVKDYGLGISTHAKKKLFKDFYRGDNKANSKIVGSGIGLLLVKGYVEMHNGNISFNSEENIGSSFQVTIPFNTIKDFIEEKKIETQEQKNKKTKKKEQNKTSSILIVEDNTELQRFLEKTLEDKFRVYTANNGSEAWLLLQKEMVDLVISDIMMPQMDGFELCSLIKSTFETSHIPIILLTSISQKATQLEGLGLGADDYITKPFDISILLQRIFSIIKNRNIIKERALKLMNQIGKNELVFTNKLDDQFIKKALDVVHINISDSTFGKDKFASQMNVSPSLLYQKIKALTDQSPLDFIRFIRFNHAMELLQSQEYTITEVSEMCGFSSLSYFSTSFSKHFGKPPTAISKI